jgi:hypothetical protein
MPRARRKYNKFVLTPITPPYIEGMKHRKTVLIDATQGRIYRGDNADAHDSFTQSFFRTKLRRFLSNISRIKLVGTVSWLRPTECPQSACLFVLFAICPGDL